MPDHACILALRRHGGARVEIPWAEVERITAAKQDLFDPSVVILELATCAGLVWEVEVADCGGFEAFTDLLARHLPGIPPYAAWWPMATDPAGRHRTVVVYQRACS
jgi:hypothetical protein